MEDKKNKRDRLLNMPAEYEQNPEIAQSVIREMQAKKNERKGAWFFEKWKKLAISAASLVLAVGIFLPVYFSLNKTPTDDVVYYAPTSITLAVVSDLDAFVQENNVQANYFTYQTAQNKCAKVTETGAIAYLMQDMVYIGANGFDVVNMKAVVLPNSEFEFEKGFEPCNRIVTIKQINVSYIYDSKDIENKINIFAKFSYEDVKYYLEIETKNLDVENALEQYVTMLLA